MSSPPTISQDHEDGEEEDEEEEDDDDQSDSGSSTRSDDSSEKDQDTDEKEEVSTEELDVVKASDDIEAEVTVIEEKHYPTQVMYDNRNILNLGENIWRLNKFVNYTVLPENNVNCFFQNRAQYWRLANKDVESDSLEKCDCCGFGFPSQVNNNDNSKGQFAIAGGPKNPITDSLKMFLKSNYVDQQAPIVPPIANVPPQQPIMNTVQHGNNAGHQGYNNNNNMNNKRMYNNNAPYASAYQVIQQQQPPQPPQQYQNNQNGYFANGGYNPYNNNNNNNNVNSSNNGNNNNNVGGYNGTALALLNLMKASRNVSGAAFQATMNNSSRYYNNMNNTSNNGFGLYKQF